MGVTFKFPVGNGSNVGFLLSLSISLRLDPLLKCKVPSPPWLWWGQGSRQISDRCLSLCPGALVFNSPSIWWQREWASTFTGDCPHPRKMTTLNTEERSKREAKSLFFLLSGWQDPTHLLPWNWQPGEWFQLLHRKFTSHLVILFPNGKHSHFTMS